VEIKHRLLTYNEDDCRALAKVAETVASLCNADSREEVVPVSDVPSVGGFGQDLVLPDFAVINEWLDMWSGPFVATFAAKRSCPNLGGNSGGVSSPM
jgi:hypothetical protein